jgi:hypothetical protein
MVVARTERKYTMSRRYMYVMMVVVIALLAWNGGPVAKADMPGTAEGFVNVRACSVTTAGLKQGINATTGKIAKAVGSAVTYTDGEFLAKTDQHSVGIAVITTRSQTLTITPQGSWDGTNFFTPDPSPAVTIPVTTGTAVAPCYMGKALNIPVFPRWRFGLSAPPTYPVTFVAVVLPSF